MKSRIRHIICSNIDRSTFEYEIEIDICSFIVVFQSNDCMMNQMRKNSINTQRLFRVDYFIQMQQQLKIIIFQIMK